MALSLKTLNSNLKEIRKKITSLLDQRMLLQEEINKAQSIERQIEAEILRLKEDNIIISEHAILRYFERVLNYNIDEIKSILLTPEVESNIKKCGNGTYPANGFKIIVKNNVIKTIV